MMNLKNLVLTTAIGGVFVLGSMVWSHERGVENRGDARQAYKHMVEVTRAAQVTAEQAIKIALDNFPGQIVLAELGRQHARTFWNVRLMTIDQGTMTVEIDAVSGSVITTRDQTEGG